MLDVGRDVDAIVFTGYYHKPENAAYLRGLGVEAPYGDDYHRRKTMPADQVADYNGHWGVRELCDIYPSLQQRRCADDHTTPPPMPWTRSWPSLGTRRRT